MRDDMAEQESSRRSQLDELLVELLATGRTYDEAGALANVSGRTVRRRMANPAFAARVSTLRGEYVGALAGQLVSAGVEAVEVLRGSLREHNGSVRLRAAHLILTLGNQLRHAQELEARLVALESGGSKPVADGDDDDA